MNDKRPLPPLHLEQAALGERDDPRATPADLDALRADNRAILEAHPPARVAASIRQRAEAEPARRRRWWAIPALAAPLAAAAAILLLVTSPTEDGVREKGARAHLVVETADGRLADGDRAPAGTTLQLSYVAQGARFGAVFSIDGAGAITQHLPLEGAEAVALDDGKVSLPAAFTLDDAPGFERFVFVTGAAPFSLVKVRAALSAGDAPEGLTLTSFRVTK